VPKFLFKFGYGRHWSYVWAILAFLVSYCKGRCSYVWAIFSQYKVRLYLCTIQVVLFSSVVKAGLIEGIID